MEMSHLKRNGDGCYAFSDRRPSITGPTPLDFLSLSPIPSKPPAPPPPPLFKKGIPFCSKRFAKRTPPVFETMEPCLLRDESREVSRLIRHFWKFEKRREKRTSNNLVAFPLSSNCFFIRKKKRKNEERREKKETIVD